MTKQQAAFIHTVHSSDAKNLPRISSYSDLAKELRNRNALLMRYEERIMDMDLESLTSGELKNIENEINTQAKQTLVLCKALNSHCWAGVGISEKQHEEAENKARELVKDFKALRNEVSGERKRKQTAQQFNLTEVNAAMAIAPFATYGFLNLFFSKAPVVSKGGAIVVFAAEIVYVFYKRNPDQWIKTSKEITTKGLEALSNGEHQKREHLFPLFARKLGEDGKRAFVNAVKRVGKFIKNNPNDNTPA